MEAPNLLNVVVPCYNPEEAWESNLAVKYGQLQQALPDYQCQLILVIDGPSERTKTDNLAEVSRLIPSAIIHSSPVNKGKGSALRAGVAQAGTGPVIFTDIDFPYTIESMVNVVKALTSADVVLGFRDQSYYKNVPPFRIFLSKLLRWLMKNVLGLVITDTQCGLKAFNTNGQKIFLKTKIDRFLFDLEFVKYCSADPMLQIESSLVELRPNIVFSKVNFKVLFLEGLNFLRLLTVLK